MKLSLSQKGLLNIEENNFTGYNSNEEPEMDLKSKEMCLEIISDKQINKCAWIA
jgi:hypothetical protein